MLDIAADRCAGTRGGTHRRTGRSGDRSDVSPIMLAGVRLEATDDRAAVVPLESPADRLALPDGIVDAVYCQQGLQFMSDRLAVITEMLRVLRPGGALGIAVWSDQCPPEPFASYARILQDHGVPEPYPNAYDTSAVTMSESEIEHLLAAVGTEQNRPHGRSPAPLARAPMGGPGRHRLHLRPDGCSTRPTRTGRRLRRHRETGRRRSSCDHEGSTGSRRRRLSVDGVAILERYGIARACSTSALEVRLTQWPSVQS